MSKKRKGEDVKAKVAEAKELVAKMVKLAELRKEEADRLDNWLGEIAPTTRLYLLAKRLLFWIQVYAQSWVEEKDETHHSTDHPTDHRLV